MGGRGGGTGRVAAAGAGVAWSRVGCEGLGVVGRRWMGGGGEWFVVASFGGGSIRGRGVGGVVIAER